jgi:hypothetical protein
MLLPPLKNRIHILLIDGHLVTEAADMAAAAFSHFDNLLGTANDRDCMLNLAQLFDPSDSLLELDAPFTDKEIWGAIKRLRARKDLTASQQNSCAHVGTR